MKVNHCNPEGVDDASAGSEVNPALEAACEALGAGLKASGLDNVAFVITVLVPQPGDDEPDIVRIASNLEPSEANDMLQQVANRGLQVMAVPMVYALINTVCRLGKLPPMSPAAFMKLSEAVAKAAAGEQPQIIVPRH